MNEAAFWSLIEKSRPKHPDDQEAQLENLERALIRMSAEEIADFKRHQSVQLGRLNRWDVWGAAYLMLGGCSDDAFEYFRGWLIALGKDAVERVLEDPDDLVELAPEDDPEAMEFESFLYVADALYEQKTEKEMPEDVRPVAGEPVGKSFDFDDDKTMKRRYPKTWRRVQEAGA